MRQYRSVNEVKNNDWVFTGLRVNAFPEFFSNPALTVIYFNVHSCSFISGDSPTIPLLLACKQDSFFIDRSTYLPIILKKVVRLVLQIFLNLESFESNTPSGWLNHTV